MFKTAGSALFAALLVAPLALPAPAAPVTDWKEISKTANTIKTAAGVPLLKRMAACKMVIHHETSWTETRAVAWRDYGAKPGETVLKLTFDSPPEPKSLNPQAKPNPPHINVVGIWLLSNGKATPVSAWARMLQMTPPPLEYSKDKNC